MRTLLCLLVLLIALGILMPLNGCGGSSVTRDPSGSAGGGSGGTGGGSGSTGGTMPPPPPF